MPSKRIPKDLNQGIYFLTLSVKNLYYLFDRHNRWGILASSLEFCRRKKALKVFEYVFMLNHIHLLVQSPDVSGFLRDFKAYTSKELRINIQESEPTVEKLFKKEGKFELWEKTNMPIVIETEKFYFQKAQYIRQNPVKKQYVEKEEHWYWSSANSNGGLEIDIIEGR